MKEEEIVVRAMQAAAKDAVRTQADLSQKKSDNNYQLGIRLSAGVNSRRGIVKTGAEMQAGQEGHCQNPHIQLSQTFEIFYAGTESEILGHFVSVRP